MGSGWRAGRHQTIEGLWQSSQHREVYDVNENNCLLRPAEPKWFC